MSAFILQKVKRDAEAYLGDKVEKAVITVPAYFDDNQRQATKDAGQIAGLEVVRLVNEPTAASFAYGLDKTGKDQKVMVFDLGGGTLDVTVMEMGTVGKEATFQVMATSGDTQLGGTDMDKALIDHIAQSNFYGLNAQLYLELGLWGEAAYWLEEAYTQRDVDLVYNSFITLPEHYPDHPALQTAFDKPELKALFEIRRKNLGLTHDE